MRARLGAVALLAALGSAGCALLPAQVVQMPEFELAEDRGSEIRVFGPSAAYPLGRATLRLWTRVENPNPFGFTLTRVAGDLFLEGVRAAGVDLPLGLPLPARQDTIVPLDLSVGFADVPALADVALRAATGETLGVRLDGTVGVDAGPLGEPAFGPTTLLHGSVRVRR